MTFEISDLLWLLVAYACMWYWWSAKGAKELALNTTRRHCKQLDLQLLDDSIALRAFWLKRDTRGRMRLWRSYDFEFSSTGDDRYSGRIVLLGLSVESIDLQTHRFEN